MLTSKKVVLALWRLCQDWEGIEPEQIPPDLYCSLLFKKFFNVYLFLRERWNASRRGAEREGDTDSEASSRL